MISYTSRPQRISDIMTPIVGVFEDDWLLLRLAERSRAVESARRQPSREELFREPECSGWSAAWDL